MALLFGLDRSTPVWLGCRYVVSRRLCGNGRQLLAGAAIIAKMGDLRRDRRHFLATAGGGAGIIALQALMDGDRVVRADTESDTSKSNSSKVRAPRAKRVIWLFMHGGPSQVDLFDPKPELKRLAGKRLPESFSPVMTRRKVARNPLLGPIKPFRPRGKSGLEISDFLP